MNFEELLRKKVPVKSAVQGSGTVEITPDYRIAVQEITEAGVRVIVHPFGFDGETLDFMVNGNILTKLP